MPNHYATFTEGLAIFRHFATPPASGISISATKAIPAQVQHIAVERTSFLNTQHVKPPSLQDVIYGVAMALAFACLTEILDQTLLGDTAS
jgi:hypothetical protein